MADSEVVKETKGFTGEPTQFRVVPLTFQLPYDNQRKHNIVLRKAQQRTRIGQEHACVDDMRSWHTPTRLLGGSPGQGPTGGRVPAS